MFFSKINGIIKTTSYRQLDCIGRPDIFIKLESEQVGGSFKSRGIIEFLKYQNKVKGLVTFTTGNHGIAVAEIAQMLGIKAIIISSTKLNDFKQKRIESFGASIYFSQSHTLDDGVELALKTAIQKGFVFIPLFDSNHILNGYGTIFEEIYDYFKKNSTIYLPIGSGSLLLANAKKAKKISRKNRIIGIEPAIYKRFPSNLEKEEPSESIADCLSINKIPLCNLETLKYTDEFVAINEDEIINSLKIIYKTFNLIVEPGAAITLAAALKTAISKELKISVITGKNISEEMFNKITSNYGIQSS
jgi:threonine dehydratase